ncbi:MAG: lactate utilization protein [Candidatus Thiodiazotropha sp. (ex Monitilora ramsayi)]|nr:lactate utilization protein [Candidatus Thiodiazotropha sp. (ex Monitilora ramsayi)]
MSDARSHILQRLRAVGRAEESELARPVASHPWSREEKLQRFTECMSAVRADVHLTNEREWCNDLQQILMTKGARNLVYAPATPHGQILQSGLSSGDIELIPYDQEIEQWKSRLFDETDASITSCHGAIAETGSLILWPDETEPRLLSLVPPVHCVLLQADQIYSTFAEAVENQGWAEDIPTNALLISGPSKSADIAQVLAYGVHGPKSLVVLVLR